jgi:undecaprenyl-diphosphatase
MLLIAFTSIFFGILLWWSDNRPVVRVGIEQLTLRTTLIVGFAQVLALIPGTSRSGVTMTAALACGLDRKAAARFSFLLAIPIIAASGLLKGGELLQDDAQAPWGVLAYAVLVSALVSFSCIHYFMKLIERMGFLPFVIYRVLMGLGLLYVHYFVQA